MSVRQMYREAHVELAAMASAIADPSDRSAYEAAYMAASTRSPAWKAYVEKLDAIDESVLGWMLRRMFGN